MLERERERALAHGALGSADEALGEGSAYALGRTAAGHRDGEAAEQLGLVRDVLVHSLEALGLLGHDAGRGVALERARALDLEPIRAAEGGAAHEGVRGSDGAAEALAALRVELFGTGRDARALALRRLDVRAADVGDAAVLVENRDEVSCHYCFGVPSPL